MKLIKIREPEGEVFSAIFTGDVCPRTPEVKDYVIRKSDEIAAKLKGYFASADLRVMQWECAVTDIETPIIKSGPPLKAPKECLALGKAFDIDVMLLANNHVGDYGEQGVLDTIDNITDAGFACVGAGKNLEEAQKTLFLERNGIKLAIVNFCENEFGIANPNKAGVSPINVFTNIRQIKAARSEADVVIVAIHGGHEHYPYPSPRMIDWYRAFADAGADAVWNCHTHCPLGMEVYGGIPIIYSPGNFYFPTQTPAQSMWHTGYLSKFCFDKKGVYAVEIAPYTHNQEGVTLMEQEEEERFFSFFDKVSGAIKDPETIARNFDAWCSYSGLMHLGPIASNTDVWSTEWNDPNTMWHWTFTRNLFLCEAHCDLIRQTFRLIEDGRLEEAAKNQDQVLI